MYIICTCHMNMDFYVNYAVILILEYIILNRTVILILYRTLYGTEQYIVFVHVYCIYACVYIVTENLCCNLHSVNVQYYSILKYNVLIATHDINSDLQFLAIFLDYRNRDHLRNIKICNNSLTRKSRTRCFHR